MVIIPHYFDLRLSVALFRFLHYSVYMTHISQKEIEHLADLARIELHEEEKKSLVSDLEGILSYFDELKEVDTDVIIPKTGGSLTVNELREDTNSDLRVEKDVAIKSFPDREGNLLKVPPVFEK